MPFLFCLLSCEPSWWFANPLTTLLEELGGITKRYWEFPAFRWYDRNIFLDLEITFGFGRTPISLEDNCRIGVILFYK
jgi:hypothetical protein